MSSYNTGTISIPANSDIAVGTGTHWKDNKFGVAPAQTILIKVGNTFKLSAIKNVNSDTELLLIDKFTDAVSNAEYFIQTSVPDTYSDAARKVTAQLGYTDELLFNLNKWMAETGVVTVVTPEGKSIQLKSINALASDISNRLTKDQNGADIPNKSEFVKNLGLVETVELARNAVSAVSGGTIKAGLNVQSVLSVGINQNKNLRISSNENADSNVNLFVWGNSNRKTVFECGDKIGCLFYSHRLQSNNVELFSTGKIIPADYKNFDDRYDNIPVGVPLPYPHRYTPAGYLTCNGQTFDKSLYPKLAEAYPDGRVPDLRGEFIRGWDDSRGVDPGRVCGSWQAGANESHSHTLPTGRMPVNVDSTSGTWVVVENDVSSTKVSTYAAGGNETRPRNVAFNYIVRAA